MPARCRHAYPKYTWKSYGFEYGKGVVTQDVAYCEKCGKRRPTRRRG